ncbi:hypothetical protein ACMAZD_23865 [Vibrio sp. nBUS_14]|uniref:hypothetical protein n=1 Tax=Vibrio sp. nBUS_14 TaxID=3395321 RepID=UPI003EBA8063
MITRIMVKRILIIDIMRMTGGMGVCMVTIESRYRRQAMRTKFTYRRRRRT